MALSLTVTRGYTPIAGVAMDLDNWKALALPSVVMSGTVAANDVAAADYSAKLMAGPYFVDAAATLSVNVISVAPVPLPTGYTSGMWLLFRLSSGGPNTGAVNINVNALGEKDLVRADGTELVPGDLQANGLALCQYEAASGKFRLLSQPANPSIRFGKTAGTGAAYTLTTSPVLTAVYNGAVILAHLHAPNTGACTLNVDGTGAVNVKKAGGADPAAYELAANTLGLFQYNTDLGGVWLLLGSYDAPTIYGLTTGSGSPTAYALTAPGPGAYAAGMKFRLKLNATNTGAATFNWTPTGGSALGAVAIKKRGGLAVVTGDLVSGRIVELVHDGTNFQWLDERAEFTSTAQAIPAAVTPITPIAHGLAAVPSHVEWVAVCVDAGGDLGYAQNDEIDLLAILRSSDGLQNFMPWRDGNNIGVTKLTTGSSYCHKTTGAYSSLSEAKWNIKAYASL